MFGLPTHWLYLVDKDGNEENVANLDCNTKKEVREEVKDIICMYSKNTDTSKYIKAVYKDKNDKTLYEVSIEECMKGE